MRHAEDRGKELSAGLVGELLSLGICFEDDQWRVFRNLTEGDSSDCWVLRFDTFSPAWKQAVKQSVAHQLLGFDGARRMRGNTMYERFIKMRAFSIWCEKKGVSDPLDVSSLDFGAFVRERLAIDGCPDQIVRVAAKQVESDVQALKALYSFGTEAKIIPRGLLQAARLVSQRIRIERRAAGSASRNLISEEIVLEVLRDANGFISMAARPLLEIRDRYVETYSELARELRGVPSKSIHKAVRARLAQDGTPAEKASAVFRSLPLESWTGIQASISLLMGAAYFVIAFSCALRVSEIRRMHAESLQSRRGPSGPYHVIVGSLSKSDRPHEWVASPMAVHAFHTLVRISEPFRRATGRGHIVTAQWPRFCIGSAKGRGGVVRPMTTGAMISQLNGFARYAAEVSGRSPPPRFTFRQGRKFLARFVALRNRSHLAELAMQFGHIDTVVTDTYYVGCDREFVSLLDSEIQNEISVALDDLARPSPVYAVGGNERSQAVQDVARRSIKAAMTDKDAKAMLARGVTLGPCEWGYCLYKQESSRCSGGRMSPSEERRTPVTCVDCVNFVATTTHKVWWQRRVDDLTRMLRLRGVPQQTTMVLRMRLQQSEAVLAALGVS